MKIYFTLGFLAVTLLFPACSSQEKKQEQSREKVVESIPLQLTDSLRAILVQRGNKVVNQAQISLQKTLKKAIKSGGLEHAIRFCNTKAIAISDSVSAAQRVEIRRLAKKYRNPLNETNPAESKIFKAYIMAWLNGKPLNPRIIPNDEGQPVFYKPIGMQPVCLNCHGKPDKDIPSPVVALIKSLYPEDKAVDFKKYELRGMWAVTFPEYVFYEDK